MGVGGMGVAWRRGASSSTRVVRVLVNGVAVEVKGKGECREIGLVYKVCEIGTQNGE